MQRRNEGRALHLDTHRLHDARMPVPENGDENSADCVEITLPVRIPKVQTLGAVDHQRVLQEIGGRAVVEERPMQQLFLPGSQSHPLQLVNIIC